jgi:hypothetical protein
MVVCHMMMMMMMMHDACFFACRLLSRLGELQRYDVAGGALSDAMALGPPIGMTKWLRKEVPQDVHDEFVP